MSKHFVSALLAVPLILQIFNNSLAQSGEINITVNSISPPTAEVRGKSTQSSGQKNFSLVRDYAGFSGLADRVSDIRLEDKDGKAVAFKQFIPGEYVAADDFSAWTYKVDLTPQKRPAAAAHISWIGADNGLLFLDDLLPLNAEKDCASSRITINVPAGWTVSDRNGYFSTCRSQRVYFLSKNPRLLNMQDQPVDLTLSGNWKFSDQQAWEFVRNIHNQYELLFGKPSSGIRHVFILPFPVAVGAENWEADTRGNTVVILSSDMPFPTQSVQRLHEQLRHEMFHLWMPNSVSLSGNYDWFYEGFALYESLRFGVKLNRLRFDDYLDTLSRAITLDAAITADRRSLIDASKSRASGNDTLIYARGMLVAFLTDLKMLSSSGGKLSVDDLLHSIFEKYHDSKVQNDGSQAVLDVIGDAEIKHYVETGDAINWTLALERVGIEKLDRSGASVLRIVEKPSGSQKKLLDKLGYNNWRNSSVGPK